jgi:hypothetical protein
VALYDAVADLPLEIGSYELERLEYVVSPEFTRVTTLVHLRGGGEEGIGEDVTYTSTDHPPPADLPLAGSHALDSFSELLDRLALFVEEPQMEASHDYRRWAFESAALDLALRQAGRSLAENVGREPRPVRFVSSTRLANPQSADQLRPWLDMYPTLRFKLDPMSSWDDELVADLAATGAVDSVDLKGQYEGTVVDQPPDPVLYRRVIEGFPEAWIEDPAVTDETRPILEPHAGRITWDAPIHSVQDIESAPWPARTINIKPSRFGSIRRLFDAYDYCAEGGIEPYGGGQWELGPGRGHIQYLASLFHPDAANDVAPGGYNAREPEPGLPDSPLDPRIASTGFRWEP